MTTQQQQSEQQYYQAVINSINQVSAMNNSSVFSVVKYNFKQQLGSWFRKKNGHSDSIAKFNNLLYLLCSLGINTTENKLLAKINKYLSKRELPNGSKITIINKLIASIISEQDQNRLNKQDYGLNLLHIVALKKAYYNWVRSIPAFSGSNQKVYIEKDTSSYTYKLAFSKQGYELEPKKAKYLKSSLLWLTAVIGTVTAVSLGLIPAVLTTSLGIGLLARLVIIGLPSIIMNIVLYKSMLQGLFKAFWKGHIVTDKDGNARVNALIRRAGGWAQADIKIGGIELNTLTHEVSVNGDGIELTTFEYKILEYLMTYPNQVISKSRLTDALYDQDHERDSNVIEVFIRRLRSKIDPTNTLKPIETLRGRGYKFVLAS